MLKRLFSPKIRILWAVLAVICLLYAVMVFLVASGTLSFTIWLAAAAFFGMCFFLAGKGRWSKCPKAVRAISYTLLAAGLSVFLICETCILSHFFDKGEPGLDYVIVLGAQMRSSGPSVIYRYRLQKAREYLDANPGTVCITTGGQGYNESVSEGEGGRGYLISLGVAPDRVLAENTSRDTAENIINSMEIIGERSGNENELKIGIITNGFHVFRGVHLARKITGAKVSGIAAYMQFRFIPNNMVRECFGILKDFFAGRLA